MKRAAVITAATLVIGSLLAVAVVKVRRAEGCTITASSLPIAAVAFDIGAIPKDTGTPPSKQSVPVTVHVGKTLLIRQWSAKCVPVHITDEDVPGLGKPGVLHLLQSGHVRSQGEITFFALMRAASPGFVKVDLNQPVPSIHCQADKPCPALQISFPRILVRVIDGTNG